MAGYTPLFFGHGRVKVGVDQSAVSVSRCKQVGTLLCRVLTSIYPVVTFTHIKTFACLCFGIPALRHAVVLCPNVTGRTKESLKQAGSC